MMLSDRVLSANESQTLAIGAKAKKMKASGIDVVSLSMGEPDFPTPDCAKEAAFEAIRNNFTHYTEVGGIPELRAAIAEKFRNDNGISEAIPENILVSCGAKHSIEVTLKALCNEGDEVLILAPFWVSYPAMVQLAGATPVILTSDVANNFKISPEQLRNALTPRTKCVIFNSPSNPSGVMFTPDEFRAFADVLKNHDCFIISDEIYEKITFGSVSHFSIGALPELAGRVITINGVSKAYAMTGWRIGYLHAASAIVKQATKVQGQSTSNPSSIAQKAALAALKFGANDVETMRSVFHRRRDRICSLVQEIPGVTLRIPDGAFYIFPDISQRLTEKIPTSAAFCEYALDVFHLALVPGEAFGASGCVRFSFAASDAEIEEAVKRFSDALASL